MDYFHALSLGDDSLHSSLVYRSIPANLLHLQSGVAERMATVGTLSS